MPNLPKQEDISSGLKERRLFKPSKAFSAKAHIGSLAAYKSLYNKAKKDPAKSFTVSVSKPTDEDISFDFFIINEVDK